VKPTVNYRAIRGCIQKFPDRVDDETYSYNSKHSLRSNTNGYGGKTQHTNSDTTAPSGREMYHLHAASPETFGYTLVYSRQTVILYSQDAAVGLEFCFGNAWTVSQHAGRYLHRLRGDCTHYAKRDLDLRLSADCQKTCRLQTEAISKAGEPQSGVLSHADHDETSEKKSNCSCEMLLK
jgi:hypothetical protein